MPPLSPGQSCCLRCGECSGLLCPVHPVAPHILPVDCKPEGRFAAPMAGQTVDRQDDLVMTYLQRIFCAKALTSDSVPEPMTSLGQV